MNIPKQILENAT